MKNKARVLSLLIVSAIVLAIALFAVLWPRQFVQTEVPPSDISDADQEAVSEAFYQQVNDTEITEITKHGQFFLVLGYLKAVDTKPLDSIMAYVVAESEAGLKVVDSIGCEPVLSPGFTVSVLQTNGMTIVVGGVGDKFVVYPGGEKTVAFESVDVTVKYGERESQSQTVHNNMSFVFAMDGLVNISDIQFTQAGKCMTGYVTVYSMAPPAHSSEVLVEP